MNIDYLIYIAPVLALSCIPISLILIRFLSDLFSSHKPGVSNTTVICTTELEALTKDILNVQSLTFDKYRALPHEDKNFMLLENTETNEEIKIKKSQLTEKEGFKYMADTIALCHFHKIKDIENIITDFFESCGLKKDQIQNSYEILEKIPSDENKRFSSVVAMNKESKEIFSFAKGQAGILLKQCGRMILDGKKVEITPSLRKKIRNKITKLHKNGQKLMAIAYKPLPFKKLEHYSESFAEKDMVLIGIVGLGDVPDTSLIPIIKDLKEMGIKQYLLSSGKEQKSIALSHELGITSPQYFEGMDNEDISLLNDEQLAKTFSNKEKDYTFFRLTEKDKERLMDILKRKGETITINDKKPGRNLKKIHEGIQKEKRRKENYRKLLLHSLSCKIMQVILFMTAVAFQAPLALTVTLILVLDITINLLLESSLNLEKTPPEKADNLGHLFVTGIFGGIVVSAVYIWSLINLGWTPGEMLHLTDSALLKASTIAFALLCVFQIFNAHNLKSTKKSVFKISPLKTPFLTIATIISIFLIYTFTQFPTVQTFLDTTSLSWREWTIVLFMGIFIIAIEELRKQWN